MPNHAILRPSSGHTADLRTTIPDLSEFQDSIQNLQTLP